MASEPHDPNFFQEFDIHNIVYKTVGDHDIALSILVPKSLLSGVFSFHGRRPVIARFHGGFLIGGSRLYSDWFPKWVLELAISRQAIIVTPDYRLLPESSGLDILSDLADYWSWVQRDLESSLVRAYPSSLVKPDSDRILVLGESAGGYLALQSVLLHPEINFKAVVLVYPMLHLRDRFWDEEFDKPIFGAPNLPYDIVEKHLSELPDGAVVTADEGLEKGGDRNRITLALSIVQNGKFLDFLGKEAAVFPVENISRAKRMPPFLWLFHGRQDSAVPLYGSELFISELRAKQPEMDIRFETLDGEHGFDTDATIQDGWMRDGIIELAKYW
ncbi:uncharacterized protein N7482_002956 [Penicillium canariense]|uniref:Alpha/beta hydrolase fold-3 domain-containing protein n=1 Tax=Penicillium canariense TaxID=189055 RepID=A0A9W9LVB7_9EURO|nr:uncharacterized protein N7482_002956 [Penicillium canariense]KAJ5177079.1 hypothetical protein N7482_002956 [Penicillium canariense]